MWLIERKSFDLDDEYTDPDPEAFSAIFPTKIEALRYGFERDGTYWLVEHHSAPSLCEHIDKCYLEVKKLLEEDTEESLMKVLEIHNRNEDSLCCDESERLYLTEI